MQFTRLRTLSSLCLGEEHVFYSVPFCDSSQVLCLPFSMCSSETLLPGNEVAGIYHEIAKKVIILSITLQLFQRIVVL